ncbi:M16 family metallopeptidase [Streptomyces sp. NRRL F-5135]|uniref:M16 family metallopeptidase n=1 Tax=Streptomyces sp. NRRL F-5135 TaxID=1463858 RepID=UPI00055EB675|nr:insulinase family protein [Streptomyces sp. NRRL F-5135]
MSQENLDVLAIRETEVDGIRTVLTAGGGAVTAGLAFRVGAADETYATRGVTHLVEHLALHRHGVSDLHYNGATATTYTLFHVTGTTDEVVGYLNGVCAALRNLPLDRLEIEREILRTEAAGRGGGANRQLPLWRYGAQGYGLTSYAELGTWHLSADAVRDWAATRFTRENAVLWITSDTVPEGLDLSLPSGPRHPMPVVTSALPVTPAYIQGEDGTVVMDGIVRRSSAAALFAEVLGRALYADLRQKGGYSYTATADYSPRDTEFATITAFADALPQKQDAVVGGLVDVLARLRAGRIEQAELDTARATFLKAYDHTTDLAAARLPGHALNLLIGHRNLTTEEHKAELAAVTLDDLREVARELYANALLQVPGRGADWAGFTEAPQHSGGTTELGGTRHPSREDASVVLTVAPEGVALSTPGGVVTIRHDQCAAMVAYPDGGRRLTGLDGFQIAVEPTLFASLGPDRIALIDAAVPPAAVVRMPARDPERIPRPRVSGDGEGPGARGLVRHFFQTLGIVVFGLLTVVWAVFAVVATALMFGGSGPGLIPVVGVWLGLAAPVRLFKAVWTARKKTAAESGAG